MRRLKIISFTAVESLTVSDNATTLVPLKTLRHTLPLAGAYLLYMLATMESVRGVNVPMYTTLRRTTVVFTMVVEYILAGQKYTSSIVGSVALIVLGAFIAGARDLSFDGYGYAIVFLSNITTAIYLATIARIGKSSGLNSFGLMWCNGIICGPVLLFWTFIRGDLEMTINFPYLLSPGFSAVLLCSCILAFFLNYSIFLNTTLNSALTQTICGNLKWDCLNCARIFLPLDLAGYFLVAFHSILSMLLGNFLVFLALVCMPTISSSGSNFLSCFMANFFIGVYDFCFIAFSSNSLNGFLECEIYWYQDKDKEEFKRVVATPY
uniref:Sugar phosphate transporter domain-containing protein n=1 Tax=Fagus sylvatica TaxID=28930 RepID=A0A2N9GL51_FAGSY